MKKLIVIIAAVTAICLLLTGCGAGEDTSSETVSYGDTVTFSYACQLFGVSDRWEYLGEETIVIDKDSSTFRNEAAPFDEQALEKISLVLGKIPGDSFTLWFEDASGAIGYQYTITSVTETTNRDVVESGDRVDASYVGRAQDADWSPVLGYSGQQIFRAVESDPFINAGEIYNSVTDAVIRMNDILGVRIGENFRYSDENPVHTGKYIMTVNEISKAVKYGDTITADVYQVCIPMEELEALSMVEYDPYTVELETDNGCLTVVDSYGEHQTLSIRESQILYSILCGASENTIVLYENHSYDAYYNLRFQIRSITQGKQPENSAVMHDLLRTDPDKTFIYENHDYHGLALFIGPDANTYYEYETEMSIDRRIDRITVEIETDSETGVSVTTINRNGSPETKLYYRNGVLERHETYDNVYNPYCVEYIYTDGVLTGKNISFTYDDGTVDQYTVPLDQWDLPLE